MPLATRCAALAPADCKTVRVTHVDVVDVAGVRGDLPDAGGDEAREALVDLAAAEPHRDAVVEIEFPGAARIEPTAVRRMPASMSWPCAAR